MKLKFLIVQLSFCAYSFSQNAENVLPIEGNVGIGTDSATCKLDVRGQTRIEGQVLIDGDLVVLDSAIFQSRIHAQDLLFVEGDAEFSQDLNVKLDCRIEGNAVVESDITIEGKTELQGDVKMQNLGLQSSVFDSYQILLKLPDGEIKTASFKDFLVAASTPPAELDYCGSGGVTPQWFAGVNKLFTSCPDVNVGIATTDPLHKLHVVGVSYAQKFLAGNVGASSDALINAFVQNDIHDIMRLGVKVGGLDEIIRFTIKNSGAIDATNVGSATSLTLHNGLGKAIRPLA